MVTLDLILTLILKVIWIATLCSLTKTLFFIPELKRTKNVVFGYVFKSDVGLIPWIRWRSKYFITKIVITNHKVTFNEESKCDLEFDPEPHLQGYFEIMFVV